MRILLVNSADKWGGGETHVYELARGLAAAGEAVTLLCRAGSELYVRCQAVGLACVTLPLANAADLYSIYKLKNYLRAENVDVIHAHLSRDYWLCCLAVGWAGQGDVVVTRHVLYGLKNSWFHRRQLQRVRRIICVSQAVAAVLARHPAVEAAKLVVIPNAVSQVAYDRTAVRRDMAIAPETVAVGIFGSVEPIKGQLDFVDMAALAARQQALHFYIVGAMKDKTYAGQVHARIAEAGLTGRVTFTGHRTDAVAVMAAMDVVVSAAREDAFGLVLLEALSQGRPVVAAATQGAQEILAAGSVARLVPPGDTAAMAEAVLALVADKAAADALGQKGCQFVREHFSLEKMVAATRQVYEEACRIGQAEMEGYDGRQQ